MSRPKINEIYTTFISEYAHSSLSNYEIVNMMCAAFDDVLQQEIGQKVPSESTVRRHRTVMRKAKSHETVLPIKPSPLENPWEFRREDPDGVPNHIGIWISNEILTNDFIRRDRGLSVFKFIDLFDAVTRRTAMWIAVLFEKLTQDDPFRIWSIAWMYSGYEISCERQGKKFVTRPLDDYVAHRPWASSVNSQRYKKAIATGWVKEITSVTNFAIMHNLQMRCLAKLNTMEQLENNFITQDKTVQIPPSEDLELDEQLLTVIDEAYWLDRYKNYDDRSPEARAAIDRESPDEHD